MNDFKNNLLDLLKNDPEIRSAINKVISPAVDQDDTRKEHNLIDQLEESQSLLNKLKALLGIKTSENKTLNSTIKDLKEKQTRKSELNQTLIEKNKSNESQIEFYSSLFQEEIAAYELFKNLSSQTKKSLVGIFKEDSMAGFIACGVQERSILNLWEYIKNEAMEDNNKDLANLKHLFSFLFSRYTLAYPLYELLPIALGDAFDTQRHIKHSGCNNVNGKIQTVVLDGWVNTKTDKVVKQSIVII